MRAAAAQEIVERRTLHVVRDEYGPTVPLENLVQGHDSRVPQPGYDPCFAGEAGQEIGAGTMDMRDFQGYDPVQFLVDPFPDRAVRPTPHRFQEAIVADRSRAVPPGAIGSWSWVLGSPVRQGRELRSEAARSVTLPQFPPAGPSERRPVRPR